MPVPKRWFPCSRDINDDAEGWELTDTFGDRALRLWLEILAILDKSENCWKLSGHWLATLHRKTGLRVSTIRKVLDWMVAKGWLEVIQTLPNQSPGGYSAPNYWKYHRSRGAKSDSDETQNGANLGSPLDLTSLSLPNRDLTTKEGERKESSPNGTSASLEEFELTEDLRVFARKLGVPDPDEELKKYKDDRRSSGKECRNFPADFRNWCRKFPNFSNNATREPSDTARCEYKAKNPNEMERWGSERCQNPIAPNSKKFCVEHKDYRQRLQESHSKSLPP